MSSMFDAPVKEENDHLWDHDQIARQIRSLERIIRGLFYGLCVVAGLVLALFIVVF